MLRPYNSGQVAFIIFLHTVQNVKIFFNCRDTFLISGGDSDDNDNDNIYEYNVEDGTWTELDAKLATARFEHTVMIVDSSSFQACR